MKQHILPAVKLTFVTLLIFAVLYPLAIRGVALLAPNQGAGETLVHRGQKYYTNIGQSFNDDKYFWSRPSAVAYNAAGSGGSNKGPSNADYLSEVRARIDTFLKHNPGASKAEIPADLVTASGSGLDPHISVQAANVQVSRIAAIRGVPVERLKQLIAQQTDKPLAGLFGPEKINVLKLNIALDKLDEK